MLATRLLSFVLILFQLSFVSCTTVPITFNEDLSSFNTDTVVVPSDVRDIVLPKTNWLATARNYILKIDGDNLCHSDDLGMHWKSIKNIIGNITFVHWFSDGTCLICGTDKAFFTDSFNSLTESSVYDLDGSSFSATGHTFFHEFNYNSPNYIIGDKEAAVWSDYDNGKNYISRIWFTNDKGRSIKCILKNGESIIGGEKLSIAHFHDCVWDDWEHCLWITTGDYGTKCKLIQGEYKNNIWSFRTIREGNDAKFGSITLDKEHLYLVTDVTHGDAPCGLIQVRKDSLLFNEAYRYLYINPDRVAFINYYDDKRGHRILFPDGAEKNRNKLFYAVKDYCFQELNFECSDDENRILGQIYGPNNNGDIISITYKGYGSGYTMNMNRYLLSDGLINAGLL